MKEPTPTLTLLRVSIIVFCLWHMMAVAVYALPWEARGAFAAWSRTTLLPIVRPYILLTSQWQQWNLFSPDPLQRVVTYDVDLDRGTHWERLRTFAPGTLSTFRHAAEFKLLGRLLEGPSRQLPAIDRFLQLQCADARLRAGTRLRLSYEWFLLPHPSRALSVTEWAQLHPPISTFLGSEVLCGWPAGTGVYRSFL